MAVNLYLKYFHAGKSLSKALDEVETENTLLQEGQASTEHINSLHQDEKVEGGLNKVIEIGFTTKSYKSAKKSKSKGKQWDRVVSIQQDEYSNTGNAWKVWDSGTVSARWIFANSHLIRGKKVHEIGSGCGLTGILASNYCDSMTISDYKQEILNNIQRSIELNFKDEKHNINLRLLDFEKIVEESFQFDEKEKADVVLGSDIIYGLHLSEWVPKVVDKLLRIDGLFICVNPKNRWGVDEFLKNMEILKFYITSYPLPEKYCEDFVKKSNWDVFICTRDMETHKTMNERYSRRYVKDGSSSSDTDVDIGDLLRTYSSDEEEQRIKREG